MKKILHKPYPKTENLKHIFVQAFLIAVAVYLFLILFQPFGIYTFHHSLKYFILLPYAIIIFIVFSVVKILQKRFSGKQWQISDELLSIAFTLFLSSVFNYFYSKTVIRQSQFDWSDLGFMVIFSFVLGIPIFAIYFFAVLNRTSGNQPSLITDNFLPHLEEEIETGKPIQINDLQILNGAVNFIFAKSEGNYCTIYYLNKGAVEKKLIRSSLSNVENQLAAEKNIVRCHRSYLLNKIHIVSKKGNAQGLKLTLKNIEEQIPVSRNYLQALN